MKRFDRERKLVIRHRRVRKHLTGTSERPRLTVHKSLNHIQAQVIDDIAGKTLVSASTLEKDFRAKNPRGGNVKASTELGALIAERAKQKGIAKVCFDRGGYLYHGRVKAVAEAARKAGLDF